MRMRAALIALALLCAALTAGCGGAPKTTTTGTKAATAARPASAPAALRVGVVGPTRSAAGADAGLAAVAAFVPVVVVFGAPPHPAVNAAQSSASAMRAALIRIPPKIDGAGLLGPPRVHHAS